MKAKEIAMRYSQMYDALKAEGIDMPSGHTVALLVVAAMIDEHTIEISQDLDRICRMVDLAGDQIQRIADK